ncbi:hypothetical protein FSW04_09970 [Baekduia soli]|uniref:Uncharacterized protein n=1 Tax=Baekduia soli TaxID=496014 RepID=A0A5B8U467_9ACTN|nr:hypothetical protein [Baekduia soli]QEC47864.1 hypothetical protein FSW04_09970 [Baekduia soli]
MSTRLSLHTLAQAVLSPVRTQATGNEISLQARPGGFGTPKLPRGGWAAVDGTDLVRVEPDGGERRVPITSLREAGEFFGLATAGTLPEDQLELDPGEAAEIAAAFAHGDAALRILTADAGPGDDVSQIQLWPEHFDIAIELGAEGTRATYGVSPGDEHHDAPYAYVAPWTPHPPDPAWNADGFFGAQAPAVDTDAIVAFWRDRRAALLHT